MLAANPETPYVFISYASADRERVLSIVGALREAGVTCWLDQHDIAGGANWGGSIAGAIEGCAALVLMSSQASLASRNVRQEIALAWRHEKPLVPLLLDTTPLPNDIAYWLATAQWIDVLDHPVDTWLPKVTQALATLAPTREAAISTATPPAARSAPLTNLPSPASSLIGREREVAEVAALLHRGRVVTLSGPGGIGKTRLAIAVAHRLAREYADGAVFVDLAPLHDASLVLPAVAAAFGMQDTGARPVLDLLTDALHDRQVLVIVDNVEQVIDAAAGLGHLVSRCSGLTLLATSREPLRISGELEYPVAPLPLPDASRAIDHARLGDIPAVALFVERASAVRPGFEVTAENAETIAAICRKLDGMPLAVELAAARVRSLPVTQLLERLEQPLRLLTGGARDLPARQQTIRDTIQWSYDLLTPDEQRMFRRLAVFVGGWTLDTAEAVVDKDGDLGIDVLDGLISLVEKSLVIQQEQTDSTLRYRCLVPIREFASEELARHAEGESFVQRHAETMRALVLRGFELPYDLTPDWFERVKNEYVDIRSAFSWSITSSTIELGAELVGPLGWLWLVKGDLREGTDWLRAFLDRYTEPDALRAQALNSLSLLEWERDDIETASDAAMEALAIGRDLQDVALLATSMAMSAAAMSSDATRDDEEVQVALVEALRIVDANDFLAIAPTILMAWADHDTRLGRFDHVEVLCQRLYALADRLDRPFSRAAADWCFSRIAALRGDNAAAVRCCRKSLLVNQSAAHAPLAVWTLELLATVLLRDGRAVEGSRLVALTTRERRLKGLIAAPWWRAYLADADECRALLAPDAFDAAWRDGSAMSLEEGIALALEVTGG